MIHDEGDSGTGVADHGWLDRISIPPFGAARGACSAEFMLTGRYGDTPAFDANHASLHHQFQRARSVQRARPTDHQLNRTFQRLPVSHFKEHPGTADIASPT
jgi:hypothetical protein